MKIEKYETFTWLAVETSKRFMKIFTSPRMVVHEEFS